MKCARCNSPYHTAFLCRQWGGKGKAGKGPVDKLKMYKPLRNESKKSHSKRMSTRRVWFENNPPDENGNYTCYLQISQMCPRTLSKQLLTLEHVMPKVKAPELKYSTDNIRPACTWCNKLKGSRTLEQLVILFPGLEERLNEK